MSIVLSVDYGTKRIGFAISNKEETLAVPYQVYVVKDRSRALDDVTRIIRESCADEVVFGLPLHLDSREGVRAKEVKEFAKKIRERVDIPIHFMDERLTSSQAKYMLRGVESTRAKKKLHVNAVAAQLILENFLAARK